MISKVNESNSKAMEDRIAEINEALEAAGSNTRITSLEGYYGNIVEIANLATNFQQAPYKYFLMPIDEPLLEIDANKRTINIPAQFKNGVGVYGDHMAEILYFSIDRYFDYQDLFNVDDIIINWQFKPANASRNANFEIKTSKALAPDDSYIPGKVVFGWVINNEMTPSKGTLTFSVSFIKKIDNVYEYMLNTQTASVTINDSLILDNPAALDSLARPVFSRLSDSRYDIDSVEPLQDPVFAENGNLPAIANMVNDELTLEVIGPENYDGIIRYNWYGTKYMIGSDSEKEVGPIVAENMTSFEVPMAGAYSVEMQGIKSVQYNDNGVIKTVEIKSGPTPSTTCRVPAAAVPSVELSAEDALQDYADYVICDPEEAKDYTFIAFGAPQFVADVSIDESKIGDRENYPGVLAESSLGVISFQQQGSGEYLTKEQVGNKYLINRPLNIKVKKLSTISLEEAQENQNAIDILQMSNDIIVKSNGRELNTFASSNPNQGDGQWLAFDLDTGLESIIGLGWGDNYILAQEDVDEAASVGLGDGHIIFWAKAEALPRTVKISAPGYDVAELNFFLNEYEPQENSFVEGDYFVKAKNYKNKSVNISENSNVVKVSYIAPYVSTINVSGRLTTDGENIQLIRNNRAVNALSLENASGYKAIINVGIDANELYPGVTYSIRVLEVRIIDGEIIEVESGTGDDPVVYTPVDEQGNFTLNNDIGNFVVEVKTQYHGSQRVTISEPFNVNAKD